THLIDELLDVSRIIAGKLRLEHGTVDLAEIVRGSVEVVQPAAYAKHIDVMVDIDPSVGPFEGDGTRLQQICWNLLANAVKFTPERGTLFLSLRRTSDAVEIAVTDTGIGIRPDFLESVFEPFRQADGSSTRRHSGLGLGLSIVKHLVEAHGGTITAESAGEGQGSTFTVRFPNARESATDARIEPDAKAPGVAAQSVSLDGLFVLVVDDDDGSREMVAAYLESRNAVVLTAASVAQAMDVMQREQVDVLVADIAMPEEDGYSLIRRLRAMDARGAAIPAAALTAFARDEDRKQSLNAGFQMHLTKPI